MEEKLLNYLVKKSPKEPLKGSFIQDTEMENLHRSHETFLKLSDILLDAFTSIHKTLSEPLSKK